MSALCTSELILEIKVTPLVLSEASLAPMMSASPHDPTLGPSIPHQA